MSSAYVRQNLMNVLKQSLLSLSLLSLSALSHISSSMNKSSLSVQGKHFRTSVLSGLLVWRRIQSQSELAGHQSEHPD